MFPGSNEIEFDDPSELADLRALADEASANASGSNSVGFTVHLQIEKVIHLLVMNGFKKFNSFIG